MADICTHLDSIATKDASGPGCLDCLRDGGSWVHLRRCTTCTHIGCCDDSPNRHARGHAGDSAHPIMQSYEPGEDWFWCAVDDVEFELEGQEHSLSHPPGWSPGPPAHMSR